MASNDELTQFIASSFRSVWALEVLCHLRKHAEVSPAELVADLRASEGIVSQSLAELTAAGLIQLSKDGAAVYAPATAELDRLASAADTRYASAPNAVRRIIVSATTKNITAFANAFRLNEKP
jgi:DNA-binding transcriptional ArsR family regulator